jgi:hypothetical protein
MSFTPGQVIPPDPNAPPAPPAGTAPRGPQPRRLSVFGGLLWILIGSLLLINNIVADIRVWQLFRDYWPVLLILLGLTKLFDHFSTRASGAPPARLVSGGEIFLLIMLFLIGGAIAARDEIVRSDPDFESKIHFPWEEEYSFTEEVTHAAASVRPVRIDIPRGTITVVGDTTGEVRAVVNKRVRGGYEDQAKARANETGIEIVEQGDTYVVRPRSGSTSWVRFDVEVRVPAKSAINARTGSGAVRVQGVEGNLTVDADGNLEIRDAKGNVEAKVDGDVLVANAAGDVRIDGSCDDIDVADVAGGATIRCGFTGRTSLRNIAKQVYFKSARTELTAGALPGRMVIGSGDLEIFDAPKDVTLTTRNYDILMENVAGRLQVENRNGKIEVRVPRAPSDEITLTNERGSIELTLPANSVFEVSADSTRGGDLESDFPGLTASGGERDRRLDGRVGTGGPRIRLRTTYDDIRLRKQ